MKSHAFTLNGKIKFKKINSNPDTDHVRGAILKNKLLVPQDRVVYGPLSQWSSGLLSAIQRIDIYSETENDYARIAEIFNNAALILFCIGDIKSARELCYSQIQMFIYMGKKYQNPQFFNYVFMPWINLIRIDRMEGNFSDAMNKLNMLSATNKVKMKVADDHFVSYLKSDMTELDADMNVYIKNAVAFEFIKIHMDTRKYDDLIRYLDHALGNATYENTQIYHEAMIVSLANMGKVNEAREWFGYTRTHSSLQGKNIFLLRECEMKLKLRHDCREELQYLAAFSLCELQSKFININEIIFAMHTACVMCETKATDDAEKLLYFCLEAADKLNDEVLKAECMILLYARLRGSEGGILLENLMIDHYVKTQYAYVSKKMLANFQDLRFVECKQSHAIMMTLFEELLSFSTIFMR